MWFNSHCNSLLDRLCALQCTQTHKHKQSCPHVTRTSTVHVFHTLSSSKWLLGYTLLLPTRRSWGPFVFGWLEDMQETLPTLITMLPTPSQTNSTFEIFSSHQSTEPVPAVGGVEITDNTPHELILAMQMLYPGVCKCKRPQSSLLPPQWPEHHHASPRWVGQWWIRACSTPAHLLNRKCPRGDGISFLEIKGTFPHYFWLCPHSHHCIISFINQPINQSQRTYINSEQEKRSNGNTGAIFIRRWLRTCGL